ncbi:hypothetical protein AQ942_08830 [Burkholderia pseudomallei]|nr:hypothetical protein AQ942_08830 [Burkholderia pseudomallei]
MLAKPAAERAREPPRCASHDIRRLREPGWPSASRAVRYPGDIDRIADRSIDETARVDVRGAGANPPRPAAKSREPFGRRPGRRARCA